MNGEMCMPVCQNCFNKWTWKQTFIKSFTLQKSMKCPYCEAKQYSTAKSKRQISALSMIPPFIPLLQIFMGQAPSLILIILLICGILLISIFPALMKLSNQEESLW